MKPCRELWIVNNCLTIPKLSVTIQDQWSHQRLEQYIHQQHTYNHPFNIQQETIHLTTHSLSAAHAELTQSIVDHHSHPLTNDYEPISDDELPPLPHIISNLESPPVEEATPTTEQPRIIIKTKKRSQEAIRRRCRRRNLIKRAHRHDFDIIRTIYPRFTIQKAEQILNDLHIRRRHCHIRRHYQLHIGLHSIEDQIQYDRIIDPHYFTQNYYDRVFRSQ